MDKEQKMDKRELVAKVLELVSDALRAGKDDRRSNPKYYINRIRQLLLDELPRETEGESKRGTDG